MHYIVSYDIASNNSRARVAKILDGYGDRVQDSVFELPNLPDSRWAECWKKVLGGLVLAENDSVRVYLVCDGCRKKIIVEGNGPPPMDDPKEIVI